MRYRRNTEETNFWAGYADCMLALFMIALLLWILSSGVTIFTNLKNKEELDKSGNRVAALEKEVQSLKELIDEKNSKIARLEKELEGLRGVVAEGKDVLTELFSLKDENESLRRELAELKLKHSALIESNKLLQLEYEELLSKYNELDDIYAALKEAAGGKKIEDLLAENRRLQKELNDKPPIINLTEGVTREFSFPSGKAIIPPQFLTKLHQETFPELQDILTEYPSIDTLEIVGHTDGSPINSKGNTDMKIPELMMNQSKSDSLKPGSNADLGLMRALSIRNAWYDWVRTQQNDDLQRLYQIDLRCYSAAQTVPPTLPPLSKEDWMMNDPKARRIEIRFTQLKALDQDN